MVAGSAWAGAPPRQTASKSVDDNPSSRLRRLSCSVPGVSLLPNESPSRANQGCGKTLSMKMERYRLRKGRALVYMRSLLLIETRGVAEFLYRMAVFVWLHLFQLVLGGFQVLRIPIIAIAIF